MSQEQQAAEQQQAPTPEQVGAQINAFRDGIYKTAADNNLSFDVVFNAMSQAAASFMFDYLLLTQGELTDENVAATVERFNSQTVAVSKAGLENLRESVKAEQARVEDASPKIITEV